MFSHEQDPVKAAIIRAKSSGALVFDGMVLPFLPEIVYRAEEYAEDTKSWYTSEPIRRLQCRNCEIEALETDLCYLERLEAIDLTGNKLISLPGDVTLQNLTSLNLTRNRLKTLNTETFPVLTELIADENQLESVAWDNISTSGNIVRVSLAQNKIRVMMPPSLFLSKLIYLDLSNNCLEEFDVAEFPGLQKLNLSKNRLEMIHNLGTLKNLQVLDVSYNKLMNDPARHDFCDISGNLIGTGPVPLPCLQEFNASNNKLASVPAFTFLCSSLKVLDVSSNVITTIDGTAVWHGVNRSSLESLNLCCNDLQEVAPEIGLLPKLGKILLEGNPMRRMRQLLNDGSASRILTYLQQRIPQNHPYYQKDKDDMMKNQRDHTSGKLKAVSQQLGAASTHGKDVSRHDVPAPTSCKLEFRDITDLAALPLDLLRTPNETLQTVSSLTFVNCSCLSQEVLQDILTNFDFDNAPSLRTLTLKRSRKGLIQSLTISHTSLLSIQLEEVPGLQSVTIQANPFLTSVFIKNTAVLNVIFENNMALKTVSIEGGRLKSIPPSLCNSCLSIEELVLSSNSITTLPNNIHLLRELRLLDVSNNDLRELPPELGLMAPADEHEQEWTKRYAGQMTRLAITGNYIVKPPPTIIRRGALALLRHLRDSLTPDMLQGIEGTTTTTIPPVRKPPPPSPPPQPQQRQGRPYLESKGFW
ncbi:Leucine-rich repeat protein [Giardia muris]|uniref:Leucine-rich repeat protein n=1 Tax=Giardia muris TaxID=5742 RepID=A0A4Z1SQP2_GIAMU|nr:Leucine-rich repeat protein [Giardia muris]|eukprot:TNJ28156.1 Leucine-rich repeat protein [Giardia muris]